MNDEKEMLNLILPQVENIGELDYKAKVKERQALLAEQAKEERRRAAEAAEAGEDAVAE